MNLKDSANMPTENDAIDITLRSFGILKTFITDESIRLKKESSLSDLLDMMANKYDARFKKIIINSETNEVNSAICILVNGNLANNLSRKLEKGDQITLFIAISGGY